MSFLPATALAAILLVAPAWAQSPGDLPGIPSGPFLQDRAPAQPRGAETPWFHDRQLETPLAPGERRTGLTAQQRDRASAATRARWPEARLESRPESGGTWTLEHALAQPRR
jgi:hypothetical protein